MPKIRKNYSTKDIVNAVNAVKCGSHSEREAAKAFGVPRSTIHRKINDDNPTRLQPGNNPFLNPEEERSIANWAIDCSRRGHPRTPTDIRFAAKNILDHFPRKNPFKDNLPSYNWYTKFLKRNPSVKPRKPEALSTASTNISEADIRKWWNNIDSYLKINGYDDIIKNPSRVGNCDESMFEFNPKPGKVLVERESKNSYLAQNGGNKVGCTVLHTVSVSCHYFMQNNTNFSYVLLQILADGTYLDPFLIYPYKRIPENVKTKIESLSHTDYNYNASGWMTEVNFRYYIENVFVKGMKARQAEFPVILFLDNHSSHISLEISQLCDKLGVILICLYPNSTHVMQPLDCAVFRGMKANWSNLLLQKRAVNGNFKVNMVNFSELLLELLDKFHNTDAVKNGFKSCGIFPWNVNNIDFNKLLMNKRQMQLPTSNVIIPATSDSDISNITTPNTDSSSSFDTHLFDSPQNSMPSEIPPFNGVAESRNREFIVSTPVSVTTPLDFPSFDTDPDMTIIVPDLDKDVSTYPSSSSVDLDAINSLNDPLIFNEWNESRYYKQEAETYPVIQFVQNDSNAQFIYPSPPMPSVDANAYRSLLIEQPHEDSSEQKFHNTNDNNNTMTKSEVYTKLKEIFGDAKTKLLKNANHQPADINEDILMRILKEFGPITTPDDVLPLPPINKRAGTKNSNRQPFIVSSNEYRQFRSNVEKEKHQKLEHIQKEKELKKAERLKTKKRKAEEKAAADLEQAKKRAMERAQLLIQKAEEKYSKMATAE